MVHHVGIPESVELYHLGQDPNEQHNIAAQEPESAARLEKLAEGYVTSPLPPWGYQAPSVELGDMMLNQLRALGYKID